MILHRKQEEFGIDGSTDLIIMETYIHEDCKDEIQIDFSDSAMRANGDYWPVNMDEEELTEYVRFLNECLNKIKSIPKQG